MHPRLLPTGVLALALLLAGCALPTTPSEPPPVLAPDAFQLRIDRLEDALGARCDLIQQRIEVQASRQAAMSAEVREVASLLRYLRADLEDLEHADSDPEVITRECAADDQGLANKTVVGRSEWVGLPDVGTYLKARVDSGAETSSLSAREITRFERDGEDWVRFKLGLADDDSVVDRVRGEWIEAPIVRRVRILQAAGEESRPVVSLMMTLGSLRESVDFTLSDRSHLNYPVLLGRRFLMDIAVIDVAEAYLHERPEFPGGRPAEDAELDEDDDRDDAET